MAEFADPTPAGGVEVGRLLAASLNPVDLVIAAGKMPHRPVEPPFVAGFEGVVIADVRAEALRTAARQGADATVNLTGLDTAVMSEAFLSAAPEGFDLVVDLVWADAVIAAIDAAKMNARVVQTGNAASPTVRLPAAAFRNKHISIIGQSVFVAPIEVRRAAYAALGRAALDGAISLDTTAARLDDVGAAWRRLAEGAPEKQIVVP